MDTFLKAYKTTIKCAYQLNCILKYSNTHNFKLCFMKNLQFSAHVTMCYFILFSSVQFSCSVASDSLWPHRLQHARLLCRSPTPRACSNSCPLSWWCHPTISSSVICFSSCLQSFPALGSFPMSQFFASGGQSTGVSASASFQWIFRTDFL